MSSRNWLAGKSEIYFQNTCTYNRTDDEENAGNAMIHGLFQHFSISEVSKIPRLFLPLE